jgi:hypothetical protein
MKNPTLDQARNRDRKIRAETIRHIMKLHSMAKDEKAFVDLVEQYLKRTQR